MIANVDHLMRMPLDDLVFEHRNKSYGAYVLRKSYSKHLMQAMLLAVSLFLLFVSLPGILQKVYPTETAPVLPVTDFDDPIIIIEPTPIIEKNLPAAVTEAPTQAKPKLSTPPKIVKNDKANPATEFTGINEPAPQTGTSSTGTATPVAPVIGGGEIKIPVDPPVEVPFEAVEIAPSFPGGERELMNFIHRNIRIPKADIENNTAGKIFVSFVVDKDGSISAVEIKKGVSPTLDAEAIRIVKLFPKFNPGQMHGKPVKARFILPIKITLL